MTKMDRKRMERAERIAHAERSIAAMMEPVWPMFYAMLRDLKAENEARRARKRTHNRKPPTGAAPVLAFAAAVA